jgi:hypothetical protein
MTGTFVMQTDEILSDDEFVDFMPGTPVAGQWIASRRPQLRRTAPMHVKSCVPAPAYVQENIEVSRAAAMRIVRTKAFEASEECKMVRNLINVDPSLMNYLNIAGTLGLDEIDATLLNIVGKVKTTMDKVETRLNRIVDGDAKEYFADWIAVEEVHAAEFEECAILCGEKADIRCLLKTSSECTCTDWRVCFDCLLSTICKGARGGWSSFFLCPFCKGEIQWKRNMFIRTVVVPELPPVKKIKISHN